jgi:hypothetical protein
MSGALFPFYYSQNFDGGIRASVVTCISRRKEVHINRKKSHVGERDCGANASLLAGLKHKVREKSSSASLSTSEKP